MINKNKKLKSIIFEAKNEVQYLNIPDYVEQFYIDAYGSSPYGYSYDNNVGNPGRAYGTYTLKKDDPRKFYVYIGTTAWNGGGGGNYPGGSAADIRKIKASDNNWYDENHTSWDTDKSLLSRIIVAGGSGGGRFRVYNDNTSGQGGGLQGGNSLPHPYNFNHNKLGRGGGQTSGGIAPSNYVGSAESGGFGYGGTHSHHWIAGSGGGGWYGGSSGGVEDSDMYGNGGGGSSYIDLLDEDDRGTILGGGSKGNGKIIVQYYDYGYLFLSKENIFYLEDENFIKLGNMTNITPNKFIEYGIDIINTKDSYTKILYKLKKFKLIKLNDI